MLSLMPATRVIIVAAVPGARDGRGPPAGARPGLPHDDRTIAGLLRVTRRQVINLGTRERRGGRLERGSRRRTAMTGTPRDELARYCTTSCRRRPTGAETSPTGIGPMSTGRSTTSTARPSDAARRRSASARWWTICGRWTALPPAAAAPSRVVVRTASATSTAVGAPGGRRHRVAGCCPPGSRRQQWWPCSGGPGRRVAPCRRNSGIGTAPHPRRPVGVAVMTVALRTAVVGLTSDRTLAGFDGFGGDRGPPGRRCSRAPARVASGGDDCAPAG